MFERAVDRWMEEKDGEIKKGEFAPSTYHAYLSYVKNYFIPFFNGMDISAIDDQDIKRFQKGLPDHLSGHYRSNIYLALKTFFGWLKDAGELKEIPKFKKIKKGEGRKLKPISYETQIEEIFKIPEPHRDIILFGRETALRIGEVCALQVGDLDLLRNRIRINRTFSRYQIHETTKGGTKEWIPLSDVAQEIARKNIKDKLPGTFLFLRAGHGYRPSYLRKLWRKYSTVKNTLQEALRHSTLSDLADLGANAFEIKALARHSDIRTSDFYVRSAQDKLQDLTNRRGKVVPLKKETGAGSGEGNK